MYQIGLLFILGMLLSKQFLLRNSTAPLRCWKCNVPYWIGFWNGPNQVWTFVSEQKLQRNLVLVNYPFKSKGRVANCITDRASVHIGNALEQFLHHNRTLIPVHTVPEQLLKRSKNLSGTVWTWPVIVLNLAPLKQEWSPCVRDWFGLISKRCF